MSEEEGSSILDLPDDILVHPVYDRQAWKDRRNIAGSCKRLCALVRTIKCLISSSGLYPSSACIRPQRRYSRCSECALLHTTQPLATFTVHAQIVRSGSSGNSAIAASTCLTQVCGRSCKLAGCDTAHGVPIDDSFVPPASLPC